MVYKWNSYKYPVAAEVVGKHFEKVEKKYGELNSKNVLESARSEKSPIHSLFEWDDTQAAEKYRLEQASKLIVNLNIEVETGEAKPILCRAFVNVSEKKSGSFINIESAFQSEETKELVLKRALDELKAFEQKYKNLEILSDLFLEIDDFISKVG